MATTLDTRRGQATNHVHQDTSGQTGPDKTYRTWFRGRHTNFNPTRAELLPTEAIQDRLLKGWAPKAPVISPDTKITAFGSCFATNISNWLAARNFSVLNKADAEANAYVVTMGEGMVNSFVIRQQFEWAWENKVFDQALWHGYTAEEFGYDEAVRLETKRLFDTTDVFILTFGLSEVWYDEPTGNVFWRTIPKKHYDKSRHKFRVSSVAENTDNIDAIYKLIRKHRPDAKIIITLSPIPLVATFRDASCLSANSVSKATLRVSIDEAMRAHGDDGHLFYWPSYEMITDVFHLPYIWDRRHPQRACLDYIMTLFEHVWCTGTDTDKPPLVDAWVRALASADQLPRGLANTVLAENRPRLQQAMAKGKFGGDPKLDEAKLALLTELDAAWAARGIAAG